MFRIIRRERLRPSGYDSATDEFAYARKKEVDMLPMVMPLKVVIRVMLESMGRRSLRQRRALSQKANEPAAMDRRMNSHLHDLRPSMKSSHSTPRNETQSKTAARAAEAVYLINFFIFSFIIFQLKSARSCG